MIYVNDTLHMFQNGITIQKVGEQRSDCVTPARVQWNSSQVNEMVIYNREEVS